jgi:DnaJ-class molecular chaperone
MNFEDLEQARHTLGVPQRTTLSELKARHRDLVKRYHPDSAGGGDEERIRLINAAYRLLIDYCAGYRFDFGQEEYFEQSPEARLQDQFSQDHLGRG